MYSEYNEKYLAILKAIVLSIVDVDKVMVFLFGSRVKSNTSQGADADIGLFADDSISAEIYHQLRNAIDDSIIPWDVDIVDFGRVDPHFKREALKDIVLWNQPKVMKKNLLP